MNPADSTLLLAWKRDADAEAFAELVRRHAAMVRSVCRRIVGDRNLADDLCQECFLTLARLREPPSGSIGGFLHEVATNRALSALRARGRRARSAPFDAVRREDAAPGADVLAVWREVEARVDAAIAALPEEQRTVLVAYFLEGRSHRELARELGIGHRTVGHRIERAVAAVRARLRREGVTVEAGALGGWLAGLCGADPVPDASVASLGKAAVAGPNAVAVPAAAAAVGGTVKTGLLVVAAVLVAVLGFAWLASRGPIRSPRRRPRSRPRAVSPPGRRRDGTARSRPTRAARGACRPRGRTPAVPRCWSGEW